MFAGNLADTIVAVGFGIGQLAPRFGLPGRLNLTRFGRRLGSLDARDLLGFGFQTALLDLLLLERQHMLHRFGLCLGGDDLFLAGRFGRLLAPDFLGLGFEVGLLDLLFLEFERVAHFFTGEFLSQQLFHAGLVVSRKIDLADHHGLQLDAVLLKQRLEFCFDAFLDLLAFRREDFAYRVTRHRLVQHTLDHRLHHLGSDVVRQRTCQRGHARWIQRVAQ